MTPAVMRALVDAVVADPHGGNLEVRQEMPPAADGSRVELRLRVILAPLEDRTLWFALVPGPDGGPGRAHPTRQRAVDYMRAQLELLWPEHPQSLPAGSVATPAEAAPDAPGDTPDWRLRHAAEAFLDSARGHGAPSVRCLAEATAGATEYHVMLRELGIVSPWEDLARSARVVCYLGFALRGVCASDWWSAFVESSSARALEELAEALVGDD